MNNKSVSPQDILPDGMDSTQIQGKTVRKGTIAAFLANIKIFEDPDSSEVQKQEILTTLRNLAPSVITIGLHKYVTFKNPQIEKILIDTKKSDLEQ